MLRRYPSLSEASIPASGVVLRLGSHRAVRVAGRSFFPCSSWWSSTASGHATFPWSSHPYRYYSSSPETPLAPSCTETSPPPPPPSLPSPPPTRLHVVHPDLLDEWVPEMNEEDVHLLTSASTQPVVWRCRWCHTLYSCSPSRRVQLRALACPACHGRGLTASASSSDGASSATDGVRSTTVPAPAGSSSSAAPKASFAEAYPHLLRYWDVEANGSLSPYQVPVDSTMSIWWKYPLVVSSSSNTSSILATHEEECDENSSIEKEDETLEGLLQKGKKVRVEYFSRPLVAFVEDPYPQIVKQQASAALELKLLHSIRSALEKNGICSPSQTSKKAEEERSHLMKKTKQEISSIKAKARSVFLEDWHNMMHHLREEVHGWYTTQQSSLSAKEDGEKIIGGKEEPYAAMPEEEGEEEDAGVLVVRGGAAAGRERTIATSTPSISALQSEPQSRGLVSRSSPAPRRMYIPTPVLASEMGPHCRDYFLFGVCVRRVIPFALLPPLQKASLSSSSSPSCARSSSYQREAQLKEQENVYLQQRAREVALTIYLHSARCQYQSLEPRFSCQDLSHLLPPPVLHFALEDERWTRFFYPTKAQAQQVYIQLQQHWGPVRTTAPEEWRVAFSPSVVESTEGLEKAGVAGHAPTTTTSSSSSTVSATQDHPSLVTPLSCSPEAELVFGAMETTLGSGSGLTTDEEDEDCLHYPAPPVRIRPFPMPPSMGVSTPEMFPVYQDPETSAPVRPASLPEEEEGGLRCGPRTEENTTSAARVGEAVDDEEGEEEGGDGQRATSSASRSTTSTAALMQRALKGKSLLDTTPLEPSTRRTTGEDDDDVPVSSSLSADGILENEYAAELRQSRSREGEEGVHAATPSSRTSSMVAPRDTPETLLDAYHRPSPSSALESSSHKGRSGNFPSSRSFRLRLPRGNPSGMVQYYPKGGRGEAVSHPSSSTTSRSSTLSSRDRPSVSSSSSASLSPAAGTPRKVGRPKRAAAAVTPSPSSATEGEENKNG